MDKYNKSSRRKTRAERQDLHLGATCKRCRVCPFAGKCYRYVQSIITIPVFVCLEMEHRFAKGHLFACSYWLVCVSVKIELHQFLIKYWRPNQKKIYNLEHSVNAVQHCMP